MLTVNVVSLDITNIGFNTEKIISIANESESNIVLFPELALIGYPPKDLLFYDTFIQQVKIDINKIVENVPKHKIIVFGAPRYENGRIYNSAIVVYNQKVYTYDKRFLPNYNIFNEKRYFTSGNKTLKLRIKLNDEIYNIGIMVCEDLWYGSYIYEYQECDALLVLNASPYEKQKELQKLDMIKTRSNDIKATIFYSNFYGGVDELVYLGSTTSNHDGYFSSAICKIDKRLDKYHGSKDYPSKTLNDEVVHIQVYETYKETGYLVPEQTEIQYLLNALSVGTYSYLKDFKDIYIGVSGGIDSAVVLSLLVYTKKRFNTNWNIHPVYMFSRVNSSRNMEDIKQLLQNLKRHYEIDISSNLQVIDINPIIASFRNELKKSPDIPEDKQELLAYQNLQARIRGNILMYLSNENSGIVVSCGNKTEYALGYATLYGDMAGGFAPIKDLYKHEVYELAEVLGVVKSIIERPPSAELSVGQTDESDLGYSYEELDRYVKMVIEEYSTKNVPEDVVKRIFVNEFKRYQAPIGLKLSQVSFHSDRKVPIKLNTGVI